MDLTVSVIAYLEVICGDRVQQALMGTKPDEELGQLFDRSEDDLPSELQNLKVSAVEDAVVCDQVLIQGNC